MNMRLKVRLTDNAQLRILSVLLI